MKHRYFRILRTGSTSCIASIAQTCLQRAGLLDLSFALNGGCACCPIHCLRVSALGVGILQQARACRKFAVFGCARRGRTLVVIRTSTLQVSVAGLRASIPSTLLQCNFRTTLRRTTFPEALYPCGRSCLTSRCLRVEVHDDEPMRLHKIQWQAAN